jgi:hypothetical protein
MQPVAARCFSSLWWSLNQKLDSWVKRAGVCIEVWCKRSMSGRAGAGWCRLTRVELAEALILSEHSVLGVPEESL